MPVIFSYFCNKDHETEWFGSSGVKKPHEIQCATCGDVARFRYTVSKHQGPAVDEKKKFCSDKRGLSWHDFVCEDCGHVFDEFVDHGEGESASDGQACPECGEHARWLPGSRIDRNSERFPYFDRGAGRVFHSAKDRREWLKRNPNIEAVEGDWDSDKEFAKMRAKEDELCRGADEYLDRLERDPAFKDYRRARDQGRI